MDLNYETLTFAATLASLLSGLALTLLALDNPDERSLVWFAAAGYAAFLGLVIFWVVPQPRPLPLRLTANVFSITSLTMILAGMRLFAGHRFRPLRLLVRILPVAAVSYLLIGFSGDGFIARIWWYAALTLALCAAIALVMSGSRWKSAGLERWGGARRVLAITFMGYAGYQLIRAMIVTAQGAGALEHWIEPSTLHSGAIIAGLLLLAIFPWGIAAMHGQKVATALHHLANHDDLTHLPNRAAFLTSFNARSGPAPAGPKVDVVGIIDLDGFKTINDTHGHNVGDALLEAVADHFQRALRPEDTVARLGGDEFVVLLRGTDEKNAEIAIRRMTKELASIKLPEVTTPVGCSAGLAARPADGISFDTLYRVADERLYQAKQKGKGCGVRHDGVVFSTAPADQGPRDSGSAQPELARNGPSNEVAQSQ